MRFQAQARAQSPVAHDDLAVGVGGGARVVGDDDQGGAGGPGGAGEGLHGLLGGQGVQGAGGLVREEDPWAGHQGAGDGDPLGLPARQLGGQLVLVPVQAELGELGAGAGQGPAARGPGQQQGDGDVVQGGQVRQELAELEDEAYMRTLLCLFHRIRV